MKRRNIISGEKHGRLTFVSEEAKRGNARMGLFVCDCGKEKVVNIQNVVRGLSLSCGCLHRERTAAAVTTHGCSRGGKLTPEFATWRGILDRCRPGGDPDYGGRGIRVCERWQSFENFLADMGPRPSPEHSIDRKDVNGGYRPGNCRWATRPEQMRNTRRTKLLTFYGKTMSLPDWADISQVPAKVIRRRIKDGWDHRRAVWIPVGGAA